MKLIQPLFLLFIASFCFASSVSSQSPEFRFDYQPGVTPATVADLSAFETAARTVKTGPSGKVNVKLLIDDAGNVTVVESVSGPGSICPSVTRSDVLAARDAARSAAMLVRFTPAKAEERPIASSGWLYFELGDPKLRAAAKDGEGYDNLTTYKGPVTGAPAKNNPKSASSTSDRYTVIGPPPNYVGSVQSPKVENTGQPDKVSAERSTTLPIASGRSISGGVLNGKARHLPKPPYPPAARAVRAAGAVTIQVLIDEDGSVFSAEPGSGHPLLRSASRLAACGASFSPTLLDGNPVKVVGVITYNFVSP